MLPVRFAANPATFGAPCSSVTTMSCGLLTYNPSYSLPATIILRCSGIVLMHNPLVFQTHRMFLIRLSFSVLEVSRTLPEWSLLHPEAFLATPSWCVPLLQWSDIILTSPSLPDFLSTDIESTIWFILARHSQQMLTITFIQKQTSIIIILW